MTQKKLGRPAKPDDEKLVRGTVYLPASSWALIDARGFEWLRREVRRAGLKPAK